MSAALGILVLLAVAGLWVLGWKASRDIDMSLDNDDVLDRIDQARRISRRK